MRDTQKTMLTMPVGCELAKIARVPTSSVARFTNELGIALERCWRDAADASTTQTLDGAVADLKGLAKAARAYVAAVETLQPRGSEVLSLFLADDGVLPAVSHDEAERDAPVAVRALCRDGERVAKAAGAAIASLGQRGRGRPRGTWDASKLLFCSPIDRLFVDACTISATFGGRLTVNATLAKGSLVAFCDAVYRNSLLPTPDRKHPGAEAARRAQLLARPTPARLRDLKKLSDKGTGAFRGRKTQRH